MISLRIILLGTLTRFLPALIVGTALLYTAVSMLDRVTVGWTYLSVTYAWLTLGYTIALLALRYRLRADADVAGRRSVVAGLLAPAAYLCGVVLLTPDTPRGFDMAGLLIGAVLAIGMFFPWLKGAPLAALTDQEAQQLLDEGRPEFPVRDYASHTTAPRVDAKR